MKSKEELNALKEEVETANKKLSDLTEQELKQVPGGIGQETVYPFFDCPECGGKLSWFMRERDKDYGNKLCGTAYCRGCDWSWTGPLLI